MRTGWISPSLSWRSGAIGLLRSHWPRCHRSGVRTSMTLSGSCMCSPAATSGNCRRWGSGVQSAGWSHVRRGCGRRGPRRHGTPEGRAWARTTSFQARLTASQIDVTYPCSSPLSARRSRGRGARLSSEMVSDRDIGPRTRHPGFVQSRAEIVVSPPCARIRGVCNRHLTQDNCATSSRRRPGVRPRGPGGRPTSVGVMHRLFLSAVDWFAARQECVPVAASSGCVVC